MINNSINLNYYSTGAIRKPFFASSKRVKEVKDCNFYVSAKDCYTNIDSIFGNEQNRVKSILIKGVDFLNDQYKEEEGKISKIRTNAERLKKSWKSIYDLGENWKESSPGAIYTDNQAQKNCEDSIENQKKVLIKGNLLILIFDQADDFTKKKLFEILSVSDEAFDNTLNSIVDKMEQGNLESYIDSLKQKKQYINIEELMKLAEREAEGINLSELTEIVLRESNQHKHSLRLTEGESVFVDPCRMFLDGKRIQ